MRERGKHNNGYYWHSTVLSAAKITCITSAAVIAAAFIMPAGAANVLSVQLFESIKNSALISGAISGGVLLINAFYYNPLGTTAYTLKGIKLLL